MSSVIIICRFQPFSCLTKTVYWINFAKVSLYLTLVRRIVHEAQSRQNSSAKDVTQAGNNKHSRNNFRRSWFYGLHCKKASYFCQSFNYQYLLLSNSFHTEFHVLSVKFNSLHANCPALLSSFKSQTRNCPSPLTLSYLLWCASCLWVSTFKRFFTLAPMHSWRHSCALTSLNDSESLFISNSHSLLFETRALLKQSLLTNRRAPLIWLIVSALVRCKKSYNSHSC